MRRCLFLFLFISFFLWLPGAYKRTCHPFRLSKCYLERSSHPEWENRSEMSPEIRALFDKPFTYLAKGKQSYVFLSSDGKYVLKLFRFNRCKAPFGTKAIQMIYRFLGRRTKELKDPSLANEMMLYSSFLAYSKAPRQTGVVWAHLNPKSGITPFIIRDKLGRKHSVDPNYYSFVIQKKGDLFLKTLRKETADLRREHIRSFAALLKELEELQLYNADPKLGNNFGILDEKVIFMDVGSFSSSLPHRDVDYSRSLRRWLEKNFPSDMIYLDPL